MFAEWARVLMSYVLANYDKTLMYQSRFNKMAPHTTARIVVCSECAVESKTAECILETVRRSGLHAADFDATCSDNNAETDRQRLN